MDAEQSPMIDAIFDLALEIIYLLTGEKHAAVKMMSIEGLMRGVYPPMSVGVSLRQPAIMRPPSRQTPLKPTSRILESSSQKILEVTNKINVLLVGEMSGDGYSGAVYSLMDEREHLEKDRLLVSIMEDQPLLITADGSPEGSPHFPYSHDSTLEDQEIPHHHQVGEDMKIKEEIKEEEENVRGDECSIEEDPPPELFIGSQECHSSSHHEQESSGVVKRPGGHLRHSGKKMKSKVKEETEAIYGSSDDSSMEEEISADLRLGSNREVPNTSRHDQDEIVVVVKEEEEEEKHTRGADQSEEIKLSPQANSDWGIAWNAQEAPPGIQSEDITADTSEEEYTTPNPHPPHAGEKPYSCSVCGKCFPYSDSLTSHTRKGMTLYSCSECRGSLSKKSNLKGSKKPQASEKPFSCFDCGKRFSYRSILAEHKRTHTGEKPYSCSECGKCFGTKSKVTEHERIHTGEKPFSCINCGKSFVKKSNLIEHERTHTGEKPYSCSVCGKCFVKKSNLKEHQKIHTAVFSW